MSTWTNFRDNATAFLKEGLGEVTEDMKQDANTWCVETGLPMLEATTDNIVGQLQTQAKKESNIWCKARDYVVYPLLIHLVLWGAKTTLKKTQTVKA